MAQLTFTCEDCGKPTRRVTGNQKRCSDCRLAHQAEWHDGRPRQDAQGHPYIRWIGSERMCGRCFIDHAPSGGKQSVVGTCIVCQASSAALYSQAWQVCYPCLYDPANFTAIQKGIIEKRDERRRQNANQDG